MYSVTAGDSTYHIEPTHKCFSLPPADRIYVSVGSAFVDGDDGPVVTTVSITKLDEEASPHVRSRAESIDALFAMKVPDGIFYSSSRRLSYYAWSVAASGSVAVELRDFEVQEDPTYKVPKITVKKPDCEALIEPRGMLSLDTGFLYCFDTEKIGRGEENLLDRQRKFIEFLKSATDIPVGVLAKVRSLYFLTECEVAESKISLEAVKEVLEASPELFSSDIFLKSVSSRELRDCLQEIIWKKKSSLKKLEAFLLECQTHRIFDRLDREDYAHIMSVLINEQSDVIFSSNLKMSFQGVYPYDVISLMAKRPERFFREFPFWEEEQSSQVQEYNAKYVTWASRLFLNVTSFEELDRRKALMSSILCDATQPSSTKLQSLPVHVFSRVFYDLASLGVEIRDHRMRVLVDQIAELCGVVQRNMKLVL